ncbi:MAG: M1 family aminopeptidase, partial [Calditrichia bacterium]
PMHYFLFPGHSSTIWQYILDFNQNIQQCYHSLFAEFPFQQEKYGLVEGVIGGGMEHQSILMIGAGYLTGSVVPHEAAHEYFGNMISISGWGHIWLSEGFATYCEALYQEYLGGPAGYQNEINQQMAGAGSGTIFVSDPSTPGNIIPYSLVYLKASTVLHMLRYVMGDSLFFEMMFDYTANSAFRYGNISTGQFESFAEGYYGSNLGWFFDQWIYGDGKMGARYLTAGKADSLLLKIQAMPYPVSSHTRHRMPVPLRIQTSGNTVMDTLWVDSLTSTFRYHLPDTSGLQITFDPENKILKGDFNLQRQPDLQSVTLQQQKLHIAWAPFFDFNQYRLFVWKKDSTTGYQLIDSLVVAGFTATYQPAQDGTYRFAVTAVQDGFSSGLSNFRESGFTTFPMDLGILVVDETRDGNGANMLNPADPAVDQYYADLLSGFPQQQFDVAAENRAPQVLDFARYPLIIWHHEVNAPSKIFQSQQALQAYLQAGGRLILSGMGLLNNLTSDFTKIYLGFENLLVNPQGDFQAADPLTGFPPLPVDTAKITVPYYQNMLPNAAVLDSADGGQAIYRFISGSQAPPYHLNPCAVMQEAIGDSAGAAVSLGFPLWFMQKDSAAVFMQQVVNIMNPPLALPSAGKNQFPRELTLLKCYPNPFNPVLNIKVELPHRQPVSLEIYNVLGQRVTTLHRGILPAGVHQFRWNGHNLAGKDSGSGIYFVHLRAEGSQIQKVVLQR